MLEMSGTSYAISLRSPRLLIRLPVWRTQGTSAARGFFLGSKAPFGYRRVKANDGVKGRPTLEVDPAHRSDSEGNLPELAAWQRPQGDMPGAERPGHHQQGQTLVQGRLHYLLTNEAYTGTAVWGRPSKGENDRN